MDIWSQVASVRQQLLDQLVELPEDRWNTETLCSGWRVRDVLAHTLLPERLLGLSTLASLARSGFNLKRWIHTDAIRRGSAPVAELISDYRAAIHRQTALIGGPGHVLDDLFIHAQDIRRPLALPWQYEPEVLLQVLSRVAAGQRVQAKISGLRLRATDVEWSTPTGDETPEDTITGPAEALILAMTGRTVALRDLSGPKVSALA